MTIYGINDKDVPWLKSNAKLIGTTFDNGKLYIIYNIAKTFHK